MGYCVELYQVECRRDVYTHGEEVHREYGNFPFSLKSIQTKNMEIHLKGKEVTEQIPPGYSIKLGELTFVCIKSVLGTDPITHEMVQNLEFKRT